MDNESILHLMLMTSIVSFIVGWVMSRQWAAHTIRRRGVLEVNYSRFKCYEVIEEISPCNGVHNINTGGN